MSSAKPRFVKPFVFSPFTASPKRVPKVDLLRWLSAPAAMIVCTAG